jgi:methionyl-tRNA formyltransferase
MGLRCLTAMHETRCSEIASIITFDDRSDTRHVYEELHRFGEDRSIPVVVTRSGSDLLSAVRTVQPELAIVCGWYSMIATQTRAAANRGFIGVHNSLLPRYRGAAPLVWALLHGEREVGLSMYTLTDGMDDGDIWAQASTKVGSDDYIGEVLARLEGACDDMIRRIYPRILDGEITPTPQDASRASYGTLRTREHGRIDWRNSAERVCREVRAQSRPYPGAFTSFEGRRLTIWKAGLFPPAYYGRPGEVVKGPAGEMMVVCGDDRAIVIEEMEFDDHTTGAARNLLRPRSLLGTV